MIEPPILREYSFSEIDKMRSSIQSMYPNGAKEDILRTAMMASVSPEEVYQAASELADKRYQEEQDRIDRENQEVLEQTYIYDDGKWESVTGNVLTTGLNFDEIPRDGDKYFLISGNYTYGPKWTEDSPPREFKYHQIVFNNQKSQGHRVVSSSWHSSGLNRLKDS